jgi:two-component system LytT family response regulator
MRALIIDDEELARAKLSRMLGLGGVQVVAEAGDTRTAEQLVQTTAPDVVFLDVDMPFESGLDLAARLTKATDPQVVFVTAHAEHALEAFELEATDYLLKPVSRARLMQCVQRLARKRTPTTSAPADDSASTSEIEGHTSLAGHLTRVLVKHGGRMQFLHVDEVRWAESADNYVRLHTRNGPFLIRAKLAELERRLDPDKFIRIHRRTIVNLEAVKEFEPWTSGELIVVLHDKTKLKLSRTHRQRLRRLAGDL